MDPITTAIVAALTSSIADVAKKGVLDAYEALKALLKRKFGSQSNVVKAVEDLESNPSSQARTAVLQEEVAKAKADQDSDLLQYAYYLSQQVHHSSVSRSNQVAYGNTNVQQQAGQNAYHISGSGTYTKAGRDVRQNITYGRTGLVVLVVIILAALFTFIIWRILSQAFAVSVVVPTPMPTATVASTPAGTLTNFCLLVRANGSDYAYNGLYSDKLKSQVSLEQFNQEWGFFNNPVSTCGGTINNSSGTTASGTITAESFNTKQNEKYNVTLVKDGKGQWKIDSMQRTQ